MTNYKKLAIIGGIFFLVGIAGLAPGAYYWYRDNKLASTVPAYAEAQPQPAVELPAEVISGTPARLLIPSLGIDLEVADGLYNSETRGWTLSSDKAHFAELSVPPNDSQGNTFIYGHYRREVFSSLHKIQPGAEIVVLTDNGYKFTYKYRGDRTTDPADSSAFGYQGEPILTLQTCTGAWMQDRQLFTSDLIRVEKL